MNTVITINGNTGSDENYVTWSPSPARIQLMNAGGAANPVRVRLRNQNAGQGRQLSFFLQRTDAASDELELDLPTDGNPVDFFVAGKYDQDNMTHYDASMEVVAADGGNTLSVTPVFVRVRRNANTLSGNPLLESERDLFLSALATLNNSGNGLYEQFRDMHLQNSLDEAHGFSGFLPWHRAYLLDLERELQKIEPRAALHYWR
ncbi:MAG TPA: tyrosinase family protein, partial [Pyrinomonadaceae bacterium]|nr:tyrosinase family protein [Pyrinomonadaceae bacterium]